MTGDFSELHWIYNSPHELLHHTPPSNNINQPPKTTKCRLESSGFIKIFMFIFGWNIHRRDAKRKILKFFCSLNYHHLVRYIPIMAIKKLMMSAKQKCHKVIVSRAFKHSFCCLLKRWYHSGMKLRRTTPCWEKIAWKCFCILWFWYMTTTTMIIVSQGLVS